MDFFQELRHTWDKKTLLAIAVMCFLWSVSSLMVFSILPVFMTEELKITTYTLGWIEGIAVSLAFVAKILSGILSDYIKQRRVLLIAGTFLSICFKALFALATGGLSIFIARSCDRLAKGVRTAPVDALIADLYPKENHGMSYGIRQFFYIMGSVIGSLIAALLLYFGASYRFVFWCSLVPVSLALMIIIRFVHDAPQAFTSLHSKFEWHWQDLKNLPNTFWHIILVSFILMLARFSDSFLALKARDVGLSLASLPLFLMGYELTHALVSLPIGWLADRKHRKNILFYGIIVLVLANLIMIQANNPILILLGYLMGGLHMGMTQSLMSTLIAENTNPNLRGSAFAIFYFTTGLAVLIANPLAGYLSYYYANAAAPFWGGFIFSGLAAVSLAYPIRAQYHIHKPII
ncbi:MAG: MFS transporter [Alphaproteobacteria bacterium]|nr:MFS transporter [Alphaproteobacteria bacterium]